MSVHYHPGKANVVVDALSRLIMGSKIHVDDGKKALGKHVHKLAIIGVQFMASTNGFFTVHPSF